MSSCFLPMPNDHMWLVCVRACVRVCNEIGKFLSIRIKSFMPRWWKQTVLFFWVWMWVLCICGNLCVNIDFYFMCAHSAVQMASNMHTMPHTHTLTYCTQSCQAEMCKTNIEWCSSVWQRNENEENRKRLHIMSEPYEGKTQTNRQRNTKDISKAKKNRTTNKIPNEKRIWAQSELKLEHRACLRVWAHSKSIYSNISMRSCVPHFRCGPWIRFICSFFGFHFR